MDEKEQEIRNNLSAKLGVDFCSEDELKEESDKATLERRTTERPDEEETEVGIEHSGENELISVNELIFRCNEARKKMAVKNPNSFLLYMCSSAIAQMATTIAQYEKRLAKYEPKVN